MSLPRTPLTARTPGPQTSAQHREVRHVRKRWLPYLVGQVPVVELDPSPDDVPGLDRGLQPVSQHRLLEQPRLPEPWPRCLRGAVFVHQHVPRLWRRGFAPEEPVDPVPGGPQEGPQLVYVHASISVPVSPAASSEERCSRGPLGTRRGDHLRPVMLLRVVAGRGRPGVRLLRERQPARVGRHLRAQRVVSVVQQRVVAHPEDAVRPERHDDPFPVVQVR